MRGGDVFQAASRYLAQNPTEAFRAVRNATGLKFGVPIQAFRWLAGQLLAGEATKDVLIEAVPPGLKVGGSLVLMKTPLRASAVVFIERVSLDADELRVELRLEEVNMEIVGESLTPLGALIASGSLDLSKPGDLAKHMPKLPPVIADAHGNRFVLDLMRHPDLGGNSMVRRAAGLLTSLITVHGIETEGEHLDVKFRALPRGMRSAASAVGKHLLRPSLRRVRLLLP